MTPPASTPPLPAPGGTISTDVRGRRIILSAIAGNRWRITEPIGALVVGHGDVVAVNDTFAITSASGVTSRSSAWPDLLGWYFATAA